MYPGLAQETDEEIDRLYKECAAEVAEKTKSLVIAYFLIAGILFFLCGGLFSLTSHWSFLAIGFLAFAFAISRSRTLFKQELLLELGRRYGPKNLDVEAPGAA